MPFLFSKESMKARQHKETVSTNHSMESSNRNLQDNVEKVVPTEVPSTKYPVVKLATEYITDATAGKLATSLLGHILFLKNQIPFPIMQLSRIPGGKANTRATKQRAELLSSFDTLSSHLDTTFSALSTAFARCSDIDSSVSQAHVAFLIGPSLTSAKTKVILGIDGLQVRVWGIKEADRVSRSNNVEDAESDDAENDDGGDDDDDQGSTKESEDNDIPEDSEEESSEEGDTEEEESEKDDAEEEEEESSEEEDSALRSSFVSHAEEQRFLQNADRLLSRTLAAADADGYGILAEMAPTQTHILIRAPRRFNHPSWIPQQNVTKSLDTALQEFMINSNLNGRGSISKPSKKSRVEGVWITTCNGLLQPTWPTLRENESSYVVKEDSEVQEEDEMIWWSWDGKLVGFADW